MEDFLIDNEIAYLPGRSISVTMNSEKPKARPSSPILKESRSGGSDVAEWGDANDFPQMIIALARKNPELAALLDHKVRVTYAQGIYAAKVVGYGKNGERIFEEIQDPEITRWFRHSNFNKYLLESITDFYWFFNCFPEMIISRDRTQITQLVHNATEKCRWQLMNASGFSENFFINANWPDAKSTDPETIKVPVLDPYDVNRVETLRNMSNTYKIGYPVSYPTPGSTYYQLAHWDGIRQSGYLEYLALVPKSKIAELKNGMAIKYHVQIPYDFWIKKYKDWESKPAEKEKRKRTELEAFNKFMTDVENTGKSIMTEYGFDKALGKELPGWKITPIADLTKDGKNIPDTQEASGYLMRALAMDPAIVGAGPASTMGAGSGSDKRVAFNIYVTLLQANRDTILEPLQLVADYNKWYERYDENLHFLFREKTMDEPQQQAK